MDRVLILGFGNPLRGDDGAGWHIVEALAGSLPDEAIAAVHQLTPEWAERVSGVELVVFVDAAVGGMPGEVRCFPIAPAAARPGSHELTPDGLLAMADELFGRCPPAYMVTVAGYSFDLAEGLSYTVAAAVPEAVRRILGLVGLQN